MRETEINKSHDDICRLLSDRKLKPAFDLLGNMITANGLGEFGDQLLDLEQNYRFMLKYTVEGITDPERQKIYQHLLLSTFELADLCADSLLLKYSASLEYQKKRGFSRMMLEDIPEYFSQLESFHLEKELRSLIENTVPDKKGEPNEEKHLQKLINLFYHFWFKNRLSHEEISTFKEFLRNSHFPVHEKAFLVTAITLGQLLLFDEQKVMLLSQSCLIQ